MQESVIYRILAIEFFIIILAELICTKNNWEQAFDTILIILIIISFVLFCVWYHKKSK